MGLVALIDSHPTDRGDKKRGDVIVVKLEDSPWGDRELEQFSRIYFEDSELEAKLVAKRASGELHPVLIYPYSSKDEDGSMIKRSRYLFDFISIPDHVIERTGKSRAEVLDQVTPVPVLMRGANPNAHYRKEHLVDTGE